MARVPTIFPCLLASLLLAGNALAADAKAVIKAPTEIAAGDLLILDGSESTASDLKWALIPAGKSFLPVDGGKRCVFASGSSGTFVFVLAVAQGDQCNLTLHTVTVLSPTPLPPVPPPGPQPPPDPQPASSLKDWVSANVKLLAPLSDSRDREQVAAAHEFVAQQLADGKIVGIREIVPATSAELRKTLQSAAPKWTRFFEELSKQLAKLRETGKLPDESAHVAAWRDIAAGLRAVR